MAMGTDDGRIGLVRFHILGSQHLTGHAHEGLGIEDDPFPNQFPVFDTALHFRLQRDGIREGTQKGHIFGVSLLVPRLPLHVLSGEVELGHPVFGQVIPVSLDRKIALRHQRFLSFKYVSILIWLETIIHRSEVLLKSRPRF